MDLLYEKARARVSKLPRNIPIHELRKEITMLRITSDEAGIVIKKLERRGIIKLNQRKATKRV